MVHESTEGEFMSVMDDDAYELIDTFYFLPQRDVMGFALSKSSGTALKDKTHCRHCIIRRYDGSPEVCS